MVVITSGGIQHCNSGFMRVRVTSNISFILVPKITHVKEQTILPAYVQQTRDYITQPCTRHDVLSPGRLGRLFLSSSRDTAPLLAIGISSISTFVSPFTPDNHVRPGTGCCTQRPTGIERFATIDIRACNKRGTH